MGNKICKVECVCCCSITKMKINELQNVIEKVNENEIANAFLCLKVKYCPKYGFSEINKINVIRNMLWLEKVNINNHTNNKEDIKYCYNCYILSKSEQIRKSEETYRIIKIIETERQLKFAETLPYGIPAYYM